MMLADDDDVTLPIDIIHTPPVLLANQLRFFKYKKSNYSVGLYLSWMTSEYIWTQASQLAIQLPTMQL